MSQASAIPTAIDALYTLFTAALPDVAVYDGPGVTDTPAPVALHVGLSDADADGYSSAADSTQGWAWLGHQQRDEEISVHCVAIASSGDAVLKTVRDQAYAVVQAATDALQSDPTFGNAVLYSLGVTSHTLDQIQDSTGATVRLPFNITCRVRLS